jgi:hypothetical protein
MRQIYGIQILERDTATDEPIVVYTKHLPEFPIGTGEELTKKELTNQIKNLDIPWYAKDAMLCAVFFTLEHHFPNHFYKIRLVDWKY